jgi:hypothetical protein
LGDDNVKTFLPPQGWQQIAASEAFTSSTPY